MGRPRKYAAYENLLRDLPGPGEKKRYSYQHNIGLLRNKRSIAVAVAVVTREGTVINGHVYKDGQKYEEKIGKLSSFKDEKGNVDWRQIEDIRDTYQGRIDRGEPLHQDRLETFEEFAEEWLDGKRQNKDYHTKRMHIRRHFLSQFGQKPLQHITIRDIDNYIDQRRKYVQDTTIFRELCTLKAMLSDAVRYDIIESNPAEFSKIKRIQHYNPRRVYFSKEQVGRLIESARNLEPDFGNLVSLAFITGLRRSDIVHLRWDQVRFARDRDEITELIIEDTKSGYDHIWPLQNQAVKLLQDQYQRTGNTETVFPYTIDQFKKRIRKVMKNAGLEGYRFHDIRRTISSFMLQEGSTLKMVSEIMGHRDTRMLERHYGVTTPQAKQNIAAHAESIYQASLKTTATKRIGSD